MPIQRWDFLLFGGLAHLCLVVGFGLAQLWWAEGLAVLSGILWILARSRGFFEPPTWCLVLSMAVTSLGIVLKAPYFLMILASMFLLAAWDRWSCFPKSGAPLAFVLILSAILIVGGRGVRIPLPFWVMFAGAFLALFCLERLVKLLIDRRSRRNS